MSEEKKYVQGIYPKEVQTKYSPIMKISAKTEDLIKSLRENTNESGWCNFDLVTRKEPDKKGNTHYALFSNYVKPSESQPEVKEVNGNVLDKDESLPF
jgi:hypothetical protein